MSATEELAVALAGMDEAELRSLTAQMTDDEFAVVTELLGRDDLAVVLGRAGHEDWRATPTTLANFLSGGLIKRWAYSVLLGQKFADAVSGKSPRQIWNLPPRYGKSQWASQWGPAWALDRDPTTRIILVSYGDTLALENAVGVRDILRGHPDVMRCELRPDRQQAGRFVTTEGGGILAAGIHSSITGFAADGIIFDDPFKNWQEAHSASARDRVDNEFRATVSSRLESDRAWIIIPMTRWHEDDLCGRLEKRAEDGTGPDWDVVRIPELAEASDPHHIDPRFRTPDPLGRSLGQPIEVRRFSLKAIRDKHLMAGTYLTASLYQQRPAPEEGGEIKRAWWHLEENLPPSFDLVVTSWDLKLKDIETGDYVVGQCWGRVGKNLWLIDQLRGQWNQATAENAIALMAVRHPEAQAHYIESAGNAPEVIASLRTQHPGYEVSDEIAGLAHLGMTMKERIQVAAMRRRGMGALVGVKVKGTKSARMRGVSGHIEGGDCHLLAHAPYLGAFLDETAAFPNGAHDDQCDAASQAIFKLVGSSVEATSSRPTGSLPRTTINTRGGGALGVTATPSATPAPTGNAATTNPGRILIPHQVPTSGR